MEKNRGSSGRGFAGAAKSGGRQLQPNALGSKSFLGILGLLRKDPLEILRRALREPEDILRLRAGPETLYLLKRPDHIRRILVDNARNYEKPLRAIAPLRMILGNGLVTSDGSFWLRQRRIAQPAFHRSNIASFARAMAAAAEHMVDGWMLGVDRQRSFDIAEEMSALTVRIISETVLGTSLDDDVRRIGRAVKSANTYVHERWFSLFPLPRRIPTFKNRLFRREVAALDDIIYRIIEEKRAHPIGRQELVGMLMEAKDTETGESMSDEQLRDEVMTIFVAGHETTATALSWTFYLLSKHPEVNSRLRTEVATVLGDRLPELEDLHRLPLLEQVVKESMRLYPPLWILGRSAKASDEVGGIAIPRGSTVIMSPYLTHRLPELWDNPEGFDPGRFASDGAPERGRFAYFPFGGGPRQCIGDNFAMMEAQLILATVLRRVRLSLAPWQRVEPEPLITLRPRFGMAMTASSVGVQAKGLRTSA
jgi:cytochrome P450